MKKNERKRYKWHMNEVTALNTNASSLLSYISLKKKETYFVMFTKISITEDKQIPTT